MKRKLTVLCSLVLSLSLLSCSNDGLSEFGNSEDNITKSTDNLDRGVIVPYEVNIDTLPPKVSLMSSSSDYVLSDNLRVLKNFPFRLKSTSTDQYLRVDGAGQEVKLDGDINDDASKFYVKVFASSTGIPYMLYSKKTNTPLTMGYWTSDPNTKIVYARTDDPSTGFEMSVWDIFQATTAEGQDRGNGAVVIESQFYIGNGGGGGPYGDPFNYVMNAANSTLLRYARYENQTSQEFIIEPEGSFIIGNIEFDANSIKITKKPENKMTQEYTNTSPNPDIYDFQFKKSIINHSLFSKTSGIKFNTTGTATIIRPILNSNNDFILYPKLEDSKLVSYGGLDFYSKIIEITHPVWVEPNQKIVCDLTIDTYNIEVGYTASAKSSINNNVVAKIVGIWKAVLTGEKGLLTETITNTRTKRVTTKVTPINSSMIKNVYYEK